MLYSWATEDIVFRQEEKVLFLFTNSRITKIAGLLGIFILAGAGLTLAYLMTMQTGPLNDSSQTPISPQTWAKTYYGLSGDNSDGRRDGRGYSIIQSSDGGYAIAGFG